MSDMEDVTSAASYLVKQTEGLWKVYQIRDDDLVEIGGSINEEGAIRVVQDLASGRSAKRAADFQASLDEVVSGVRPAVAEAMRTASFGTAHTGGGCMAWIREVDSENADYLLITNEGFFTDLDGDPTQPYWTAGRYRGDAFVSVGGGTLDQTIEICDRLPIPTGEIQYDTVADFEAANASSPSI